MNTRQLLIECTRGQREAQQELYRRYAPVMLGVCYRYSKSLEDAEDMLQEGFIKVFTRLHQYRHEGDLGAWMRRIMVNTAITYMNSHQRYRKYMNIPDMPLHPVSDENPEIKMDVKQIVEMIRQLPAGYQLIFNLVAVEGFDHTEVSGMTGLNINTVRSRYSRARAMLVTMLKKNEVIKENTNYAGNI